MERSSLTTPSRQSGHPEIVSALCGAHAQVLSAAELSVALRVEGATRSDVRAALWERRQLVKMYGPRGTVHLLTTADLPMWIGAFSSIPQSPSPFPKDVQMTEDQTEQVVAAIGKSLEDAELTIDELTDAVVEATGPWAGDLVMEAFQGKWPRWRQAMTLAAHRGVLCFAPNRGRKVTYTNPLRYLSDVSPLDGPTAQRRLVQRYLHAYGPATPQNFAQWLNAPRGWAGSLFRSLAGDIEEVDFEGTTAWVNSGDTAAVSAEPPRGVRLLPYFDAYVVAAQPRGLLYPGLAAGRALTPSGQAGNYPVLLVDGTVKGVWHQRRSGRKIHVTVEPLEPLSTAHLAELDEQVERVGAVLEGKPTLTVGTVTVGAHA
ncbi:winged helix DNA-binding domain-containing protein [Streptomyces lushanensis]|uniref:winged helix DNA-binding domain-containing protein n=1 Tax=Streptomyces lushanensis TaxID=1434255 RepID=UPI000A48A77E|nr:winged helix DNA-binding domain-containing protein [Streptomyces lushanensis]